MSIPYDKITGINPQDAHFLDREVWDLKNTPPEKRPLLLHYHPLVIYRFQVLKQADVVLALFLQGDHFSYEQKRNNFEYYDPITTGDSTLSGIVQSIIAAEVGYRDLALRYFYNSLFVDLADLHGNVSDGVHVASTGGVWNILAQGFARYAGLQREDHFRPALAGVVAGTDVPDHPPRHPNQGRPDKPRDRFHSRRRRSRRAVGSRRTLHRHSRQPAPRATGPSRTVHRGPTAVQDRRSPSRRNA